MKNLKNMRHFIGGIAALMTIAGVLPGCESEYTIYEGPAYVQFADTLSICPAQAEGTKFPVAIASLQRCDYDRTYGVEVVAQNSDASYGWHYTLDSQSITIPAGETAASVGVLPIYDNLPEDAAPRFELRLVSLRDDEWSQEGSRTKVELRKIKPFDIREFEGYCRISSGAFFEFGHPLTRTFSCEVSPTEENTLVMHDLYWDGYDIRVRIDASDPLNPELLLCDEQVVADARDFFGRPYGDNQLLADNAPGYKHPVNLWKRTAEAVWFLRVDKVGTVGVFLHKFTWIEDYEAE